MVLWEDKRIFSLLMLILLIFSVVDLSRNLRYYYLEATQTPDYEEVGMFVSRRIPASTPILLLGQGLLSYFAEQSSIFDCRSMESYAQVRFGYVIVDSRFSDKVGTCLSRNGLSSSMLQLIFQTEREPQMAIYSVLK